MIKYRVLVTNLAIEFRMLVAGTENLGALASVLTQVAQARYVRVIIALQNSDM